MSLSAEYKQIHNPSNVYIGAGAGFALEDVYVLVQSVHWAHERGLSLADALNLFDKVRSPHYEQMVRIQNSSNVLKFHCD